MSEEVPSTFVESRWFVPLAISATIGIIHSLFSLYWAFGGDWLIWTLGHRVMSVFDHQRWLLAPVSVIKICFALLPPTSIARRWPGNHLWRLSCWFGAFALMIWGGINVIVGQLVLAGIVQPKEGYDRCGIIGHAWLWDPLFFAWGCTLALGLLLSRHVTAQSAHTQDSG